MSSPQLVDLSSPDFAAAVAPLVSQGTSFISDINASFVLTSGYLVFMMQLGFALLTVGLVRTRSVKSICLKNIIDASAGGIGYWLFGWAFAYGDPFYVDDNGSTVYQSNAFIGSQQFAMSDFDQFNYYKWLFQFVFAISTATIISGAVAERMKFQAYLLYAFFLTAWVYPVLTHWVWSPTGWASPTRVTGPLLLGSGAYDTVGSGAVHMVGGLAAGAGAWVLGPRTGRFINGKPQPMPGHNSVFFMSGVLLLWFGFYGFNPGTMGQIINPDGSHFAEVVARCAISTSLGGCFGGVVALMQYFVVTKIRTGRSVWDLHQAGNGALCGMIVITSGCGTFEPWAAAVGGIVGGMVYLPSSLFFLHIVKLDDVVDATTVHGTCGCLGVLWEALLSKQGFVEQIYGTTNPDGITPRHYGWWQGDNATVLGANVIWILAMTGWTLGMMVPFFYALKLLGQLRVSPEEEMAGVDASHHGGAAYLDDMSEGSTKGGLMYNDASYGFKDSNEEMSKRLVAMETEMRSLRKLVAQHDGNGKA
ncbi:hypothetical protein WJX73_004901 [Symbiochloris irregularis]|uniref:Ammonium transporter AmtB-like domain-containing protein n=1 Tax=Symbiochloris irregularis TaxID=706552 RepID=A0AAW1P4N5_9CHLO